MLTPSSSLLFTPWLRSRLCSIMLAPMVRIGTLPSRLLALQYVRTTLALFFCIFLLHALLKLLALLAPSPTRTLFTVTPLTATHGHSAIFALCWLSHAIAIMPHAVVFVFLVLFFFRLPGCRPGVYWRADRSQNAALQAGGKQVAEHCGLCAAWRQSRLAYVNVATLLFLLSFFYLTAGRGPSSSTFWATFLLQAFVFLSTSTR